jgi:two-component system sensor histidine kinase KdpD
MSARILRLARDLALGAAVIGVATAAGSFLRAGPTTVALVLFTLILLLAAWRGVACGILASLLATACLNFFFLPPLHTWHVRDPENWVDLGCLLGASILAARIVTRARREAEEAQAQSAEAKLRTEEAKARRNEIEALYQLSVDLFRATRRIGSLQAAAERALVASGARGGGGLVLFGESPYRQRIVLWVGPQDDAMEDLLAAPGRHRRTFEWPAPFGRDVYLPLLIEGRASGVFVARQTEATTSALESISTLLALAVEREHLFQEQAHVEALVESDALKTSLLRAVSHDLTTPLTAIALHTGQLRRRAAPEVLPSIEALEVEVDRLRRRIDGLLAMARLEAGALSPSTEPTPPADLFRAVRENLSLIARSRPIAVRVEPDCPDLDIDPSLALEIIVNLVENAHRSSPAHEPITLLARRHPAEESLVRLEILDQGHGIPLLTPGNKPDGPSDVAHRGLGLEIAQGLARALRGTVTLANRNGGGTVAQVDLPAAEPAAAMEETGQP